MTDKTAREGQELKPCPFCGGEGAFGEARYSKSNEAWWGNGSQVLHAHFVSCIKCGGNRRGIVGGQQTKAEAVAYWNTRALEAERDALREALEAVREHIMSEADARDYDPPVPCELVADMEHALAISEKSE